MSPEEAVLEIEGMHCTGCATNIEHFLRRLKGVTRASVDFKRQRAAIVYDGRTITLDQILATAIFREPSNFSARVVKAGGAAGSKSASYSARVEAGVNS